ncbi:hypothetical protein NA644_14425 [Pseudomonas stutzeri]|uniref:Uncharacterized protein n=1 Tax=Stutzerimonas stutzeri TaxID=316 RepID=A0A2N8T0M5_STUST|nr:hypothetical protein [Stutzerimonas stutzeri]MCQ4250505.1 hypothetical protein [Stutzerimonas stutzeri]PNG08288.1 hypothetical protein CXL00_04400 [Stutzerimonas stutzeri]
MEVSIALILAACLVLLGNHLSRVAAERHRKRLSATDVQALQHSLEILQFVQKHRGLGGQPDAAAAAQRLEVASHIDRLWQEWKGDENRPAMWALWQQIRQNPADFEPHCILIEQLLESIHVLELRLVFQGNRQVSGLCEACRALEDLGRLRGLAVRAANFEKCPLDMQIQMRYLCLRLTDPISGDSLHNLIEHLECNLIDAPRVSLAPAECYALITPIIDERLQGIRHSIA